MHKSGPVTASATPAKFELTLTPKLRADLRVLNSFRPDGMTRVPGGWCAIGRFLANSRGVQLIALGHARIKITTAGRRAIGVTGQKDD